MAAPLVRTKTPGIYRRGSRYVVKHLDRGRRWHTATAPTLAEAKDLQARLRSDDSRGELTRAERKLTFRAYALEWLDTYTGRTSAGIKQSTLEDYRRALINHAIPFFGSIQLQEIQPRDIKRFAAKVAARGVSRHTVRLALAPVKAMLATAFEDGLVPTNAAANVRTALPARDRSAEERPKALTPTQLAMLLDEVPERWRTLIELLAVTGLRIGEAIALQWDDVDLKARTIRVRRGVYRGVVGTPKSKHGVRSVPLCNSIVKRLRAHKLVQQPTREGLVFPSRSGTLLMSNNVLRKVLKPAAARAGVPWAGLHTLRHTFASQCFRNGCNAKQVQLLLGHHSAAFTLETYVHLMPEDLPDLAFLDTKTAEASA